MRTEPRELLAVGIFGRSRVGDRIEILLRRGRTFSPCTSVGGVAAGALILGAMMLAASAAPPWIAFAQPQTRPVFDVVSVKRNLDGGSSGSFRPIPPGRLTAKNIPLANLIQVAYGDLLSYQIIGAPAWINSRRYDVEASVEGNPGEDRIIAMMQPLLEDRFKLRAHRETRQLPVLTLTASKGGIKLKRAEAGGCIASDRFHSPQGEEGKYCGSNTVRDNGSTVEWNASGIDMAGVTKALSSSLRRTVVDATGFRGAFDIHVQWASDHGTEVPTNTTAPTLFAVLHDRLGLKLESARGPVEVLVIDHLEEPDAN